MVDGPLYPLAGTEPIETIQNGLVITGRIAEVLAFK
jgi:hypothetical protein